MSAIVQGHIDPVSGRPCAWAGDGTPCSAPVLRRSVERLERDHAGRCERCNEWVQFRYGLDGSQRVYCLPCGFIVAEDRAACPPPESSQG